MHIDGLKFEEVLFLILLGASGLSATVEPFLRHVVVSLTLGWVCMVASYFLVLGLLSGLDRAKTTLFQNSKREASCSVYAVTRMSKISLVPFTLLIFGLNQLGNGLELHVRSALVDASNLAVSVKLFCEQVLCKANASEPFDALACCSLGHLTRV